MWILKGPKGEEHYLTTNKVHVVSRKTHGNIVLADDESVSRTHAKVEVSFEKEHVDDPRVLPEVFLIECSSKYGTFVNKGISTNCRLPEGTRLQLKDGDRIRFGIQHNEWKLQHVPFITTTSTLNAEQKLTLSEKVTELGGHMVADWQDDCTHVTMNKITLTVKVVCALARGRQIVAPEYWQLYLSAATSKSELPDYKNHIPPLAERSLSSSNVSFTIDERRASLFKGKLFVFHSIEQHNAFSCMVFAAGGMCVIADGCGMSSEEMLALHVIVMGYPFQRGSQETQFTDSFRELKSFLMSKGKRLISESEIGLAVLHCSTERYCNPQFSTESSAVSQRQSALSRNTVMKVTQEASEPREKTQNIESSQDSFPSLKTKRRNRIPVVIIESDSESSGPELEVVPMPLNKMSDDETDKQNSESRETCSKKRLRSVVDIVENPSKRMDTKTSNLSKLHTVQVHDASSSKMKNMVSSNSSEVNTFTTESAARDASFAESRLGRNNSFASHSSLVAKHASRRISDSSDEEEPLFSFVDDPKKPATKRRNVSKNEGRPTFTFVDEVETNHATGRKRTVRNNSDSDEDDDNAATKFAFVEDPSTKFAETYFPDKAWTTSTKRPIQEVSSHDNALDEPPPKRQSVETSWNRTSRIVDLAGFISTVRIKDEDVDNSYIAGLPDYVVAMNNTVIVTVGATVIKKKAGQDSSINGKNSSSVKNFKKFTKVNPVRQNIVPTIIGGSDLVITERNSQYHAVNSDVAGLDDRHNLTFHFVDD